VGGDSQPYNDVYTYCAGEFVSLSYDFCQGGETSALFHVSNRINFAAPCSKAECIFLEKMYFVRPSYYVLRDYSLLRRFRGVAEV
jgi:hypothetical protein